LHSKITSPQAIIVYFPSGNPKLVPIFGGRGTAPPLQENSTINANLPVCEPVKGCVASFGNAPFLYMQQFGIFLLSLALEML
jgi:hypothetical protein